MRWIEGRITAVQEGRFLLAADDGRVRQFVLAHNAAAEPQDLPALSQTGVRVRLAYRDSRHLLCGVAQQLKIEE